MRFLLHALLLAGLLGSSPATAATPPTDAQLAETLRVFNAGSVFDLPALSAPDREKLRSGEVVKLILPDPNGNLMVVGLLLCSLPRDQVWLASQDVHFASPNSATEARLSVSGDRAVWYGYLDLPAPFTDRHWVVNVWNNHELAASSGDRMWEHPWRLDADGPAKARPLVEQGAVGSITVEAFDKAIFTPVNKGAWVFIDLGEGQTLLGYHATSEVGGSIPERLVAEFVRAGLEDLLRRVERLARDTVPGHYTGSHAPVLGGSGQPVPPL